MSSKPSDTNLLFAVLAYQHGYLDQVQFVESCAAYTARPEITVADWLGERDWLAAEERTRVQMEMGCLLEAHQGDCRACLQQFMGDDHVRQTVQLSLDEVPSPVELDRIFDDPELVQTSDSAPLTEDVPAPHSRQRYVLVGEAKEGGIGRVWRARDTHLGREVALKELRRDRLLTEAHRSRFLAEAQVTAQLTHPNIVPAFELVAEGEQPFYTMQYVEGRTLTEAVLDYHKKLRAGKAGPLELRSLLGALVSVCKAVDYAHDRGVLHRDLKGPNVILGNHGEVFLLDWGMAKVLGETENQEAQPAVALGLSDSDAETIQGERLGTPQYMAPEQAGGRVDLIDRRTDVYALGVILYEILTGRLPFSVPQQPPVEEELPQKLEERLLVWNRRRKDRLYFKIQNEAPPSPRQAQPSVSRALEQVCLKCLAKKRDDRYATARDLAQEIERWLADEPVQAWREPWTLRTVRFARRHRVLVASLAVLLLAALPLLAMLYVVTERSRDDLAKANANLARANEQLANARENEGLNRKIAEAREEAQRKVAEASLATMSLFIERFQERLQDKPGNYSARRELLGATADELAAAVPHLKHHKESRRHTLTANLYLGELYLFADNPLKAAKHLEDAYEEARKWHKEDSSSSIVTELLGRASAGLGEVARTFGRATKARDYLKEALLVQEELSNAEPKNGKKRLLLVARRLALADAYLLLDDRDNARTQFKKAALDCADLSAGPETTALAKRHAARCQLGLARIWLLTGQLDRADEALEEAAKLTGYEERSVQARRDSAQLDELRGQVQLARSVPRTAPAGRRDYFSDSYDKRKALFEEERENPLAWRELAQACCWRGLDAAGQGRLEEADRFFQEGYGLCDALHGNQPDDAAIMEALASTCHAWGKLRLEMGDLDKARALFGISRLKRQELRQCDVQNPRLSQLECESIIALALLEWRAGKTQECLEHLEAVDQHTAFGKVPEAFQETVRHHFKLCQAAENLSKAAKILDPHDLADVLLHAAQTRLHKGQFDRAMETLDILAVLAGQNSRLRFLLVQGYGYCHAELANVAPEKLGDRLRGFREQLAREVIDLLRELDKDLFGDPWHQAQLAHHSAFRSTRHLPGFPR